MSSIGSSMQLPSVGYPSAQGYSVSSLTRIACVTLRFLSQRMLEKKTWAIDDAFMVLAIVRAFPKDRIFEHR